ncbi:hypothetical protein [Eisenbergiella massiliensis]|uniref:hypothetical protein n=1 Tax=Eisenbergiella massiliensis TaxID=1720294 RepID=UPI0015E1A821|nr:hypothetical protein [Eisenbergiella massiliensis]
MDKKRKKFLRGKSLFFAQEAYRERIPRLSWRINKYPLHKKSTRRVISDGRQFFVVLSGIMS